MKKYKFKDFKIGIVYDSVFGYNFLDKAGTGYIFMDNNGKIFKHPNDSLHPDKSYSKYSTLEELKRKWKNNIDLQNL